LTEKLKCHYRPASFPGPDFLTLLPWAHFQECLLKSAAAGIGSKNEQSFLGPEAKRKFHCLSDVIPATTGQGIYRFYSTALNPQSVHLTIEKVSKLVLHSHIFQP
jgi:hypothetical protein